MFTGIVQKMGTVAAIKRQADSVRLTIRGVPVGVAHGESVAVNGVCLTAVGDAGKGEFVADVMAETLKRTTIGRLEPGEVVNLERAATLGTFLGGHLVQGHVDGVGRLESRTPSDEWEVLRFEAPAAVTRYLVEKGSVAVSGVSLTVVAADEEGFTVSLIPTTLRDTILGKLAAGAAVNLEADIIGKYIVKYMQPYVQALVAQG
jgi:riboflavin synthase